MQLTMLAFIDALEYAATDKRISGILVRLGNASFGFAQAQGTDNCIPISCQLRDNAEIREAVLRFRSSGKKVIAYAEVFGEARSLNVKRKCLELLAFLFIYHYVLFFFFPLGWS